ncbi:MAG: acyl carrier protein [Bacilli bacterium]|nr:acyl carrier protein [Bacilli bacterium]
MVFEKVRAMVAKQLNFDESKITLETHLIDDLGADSLDAVDLIMSIEDEFGIEIDDDAAQNARTIGELVKYIESRI